jgi:transcriptional regulator with XRE-family HTH domain
MLQKPLAKVIGENIADHRRRFCLTQVQLADRLDIGQDALSRMEKGMISPKIARLRDFAAALQCSVTSLFREQEECSAERAATFAELIRPLPVEKQDAVLRVVGEMVRLAKPDRE